MEPPFPCSTIARAARWPTTNDCGEDDRRPPSAMTRSFSSRNGSSVHAAAFEMTTSKPSGVLVRLAHGSIALGNLCQLRLDRPRVGRRAPATLRDPLEPVGEMIDEVDPFGAFTRKAERRLASHAAAASRDEHDLASMPFAVHPFPSVVKLSRRAPRAAATSASALPASRGVPTVSYCPATYASSVMT